MKPRAIISVTDKTGALEFAKGLADRGFEIVSTGGTAKAIREAGVEVRDVADVTGFPEMMDGRVKTLHPLVHGGLLGDTRLESHRTAMAEAGIVPVSILAVNLYAFEKTVTGPHDMDQAIESIDIGGPAMIRAAAKNWANVAVVVDPADYDAVLHAVRSGTLAELRLGLCAKAFRHTAFYDSMIARYLTEAAGKGRFQETFTIGGRLTASLAGQSPDDAAALFADPFGRSGTARAQLRSGMNPGAQTVLDADVAWREAARSPFGTCVLVNAGEIIASGTAASPSEGLRKALNGNASLLAGAVAAFRAPMDEPTVATLIEIGHAPIAVVATRIEEDAITALQRSDWGKNVTLLEVPEPPEGTGLSLKSVGGGFVVEGTGRGL